MYTQHVALFAFNTAKRNATQLKPHKILLIPIHWHLYLFCNLSPLADKKWDREWRDIRESSMGNGNIHIFVDEAAFFFCWDDLMFCFSSKKKE